MGSPLTKPGSEITLASSKILAESGQSQLEARRWIALVPVAQC